MSKNISLFDLESTEQNLFSESTSYTKNLDVAQMEFIGAESITWEELFKGYDNFYAITYSSGIKFACALLQNFQYAEIIFGCEDVISYGLHEIISFQDKTIERLRETSSKAKIDLAARIDDQTLKMYVARQKLSHEKIYLLEANDGRKRVVMGSANMFYTAFSGKQRENICYIDGERAYEWYKNSFNELKDTSSDNITIQALKIANAEENLDEIPVMNTIKVKKALIIESNPDLKEEVRFGLEIANRANKMISYIPKADKKGN